MDITGLRTYFTTHVGDTTKKMVVFLWQYAEVPKAESQVRVVISDRTGNQILESPLLSSEDSSWLCDLKLLMDCTVYLWYIKSISNNEEGLSACAQFHYGPNKWETPWIVPLTDQGTETRCPAVRSPQFSIVSEVVSAFFYASACGIYKAFLNSEPIGDIELTPGWSSYHKQIYYQCYDLTTTIQECYKFSKDKNQITIWIADGWFRGPFGHKNTYGSDIATTALLIINYKDGRQEKITSNDSWESGLSPVTFASIYHGEHYDARLEFPFQSNGVKETVRVTNVPVPLPEQQRHEAVKVHSMRPISQKILSPKGEKIFDLGQNMVGRMCIQVSGQAGTIVKLFHGEILDTEGNFFTKNLGCARAEVFYTLRGGGREEYTPTFTFMGFRYVKVVIDGNEPTSLELLAEVLTSNLKNVGKFSCNNGLINQLVSNIQWGMRGNFIDLPTDCPQRSERLGWTGDTQVFSRAAAYFAHTPLFYHKWITDLVHDQHSTGEIPHFCPDLTQLPGARKNDGNNQASSGWADAITIVPWETYLLWGYKPILDTAFPAMIKWIEYVYGRAKKTNLIWYSAAINYGGDLSFADWHPPAGPVAAPNATTGGDLISTAYFAHSVEITAKTAVVLDQLDIAKKYFELFEKIKRAIATEFISGSGRLLYNSQTAYCLMIAWGLCPQELIDKFGIALGKAVENTRFTIGTGFLGTPLLLKTLCMVGRKDLAMILLLQEKFPSWLNQVKQGATTLWERWNGTDDIGNTSYNHYASGAVGEWLFSYLAGIRAVETNPGFKEIHFEPVICPEFTIHKVQASHECIYGMIKADWHYDVALSQVEYFVELPPLTSGYVVLPENAYNVRCAGTLSPRKDKFSVTGGKSYRFIFTLAKRKIKYPQTVLKQIHN